MRRRTEDALRKAANASKHRADVAQSVVNLTTCILGAGALGYPFCFKECGLVLATIIMLVTLLATRASYHLLLHCVQLSCRKTYEGIAEQALGRVGRHVVEGCIAAMNLGALVAFLDILADVLSAVAGTIIPPGAEPSRNAYITGVTLAGALPVCLLVREHALIAALSNASVVFVVIFAVVMFCTAFAPYLSGQLAHFAVAGSAAAVAAASTGAVAVPSVTAEAGVAPVLHVWHVQGVLVSLPVMAYGFTAHQYYMGIYAMLQPPSVRKMKRVTDAALLACAGVYWVIGVGGYATFGEHTAGDIIRNLGGLHATGLLGAYERALKLCYGLAILGNIPLVVLPFISILQPLLPTDLTPNSRCSATSSWSLLSPSNNGGSTRQLRHSTNSTSIGNSPGWPPSHTGSHRVLAAASEAKVPAGEDLSAMLETRALLQPCVRERGSHQIEALPLQQLDSCAATAPTGVLSTTQHALVVVLVLGVGLASAVWLPNVELIFGLTGSTASVLVAFIIPAVCFLRLYAAAPELGGGTLWCGNSWGLLRLVCGCCGGLPALFRAFLSTDVHARVRGSFYGQEQQRQQPSHHRQQVLVVPELRAQWVWRQRMAVVLLMFGFISGLLCTDAILSSIWEEKATAQLAQELVAHEAVVAETSRAQHAAQQAQAAVAAVSTASQHVIAISNSITGTLDLLTSAGLGLRAMCNISSPAGDISSSHRRPAGDISSSHSLWDLKGLLQERKQRAAEAAAIMNVQAALWTARHDVLETMSRIEDVAVQLQSSIQQMKDAAALPGSAFVPEDRSTTSHTSGNDVGSGNGSSLHTSGISRVAGAVASQLTAIRQHAAGANAPGNSSGSLLLVRESALSVLAAFRETANVLGQSEALLQSAAVVRRSSDCQRTLVMEVMDRAVNVTAASVAAMTSTRQAMSAALEEAKLQLALQSGGSSRQSVALHAVVQPGDAEV